MKYIKLYERKDIEKSDRIDKLFNDIYKYVVNFNDHPNKIMGIPIIFLDRKTSELYITYKDDEFLLLLNFSDVNGSGFGSSNLLDMDIDTIFIDCKLPNKVDGEFILKTLMKEVNAIKHEITHLFDKQIYDSNSNTRNMLNDKDLFQYYNTPKEINAYYMMTVNDIIFDYKKGKLKLDDFQKLKDYFTKDLTINLFYTHLNSDNRKKLLNRLYNLFNDLKDSKNTKL